MYCHVLCKVEVCDLNNTNRKVKYLKIQIFKGTDVQIENVKRFLCISAQTYLPIM